MKKCILPQDASTAQPAPDVPGTSPKGYLKLLITRNSKGESDNLTVKLHFGSNRAYVTYLFLNFTGGENASRDV